MPVLHRCARRVLLFGGTFDPPHRGHAALLAAAARRILPDRILIIPAYHAPLKGMPETPARDRLALLRLWLRESLPRPVRDVARIDERELRSRRRVYTIETLRQVRAAHPGAELNVVVGSDAAAQFPRWRDPSGLKGLARWWTGLRPGTSGRVPPHFSILPGRFPEEASRRLRRTLTWGENTGNALGPGVEAKIARRGLYGAGLLARLRAMLKTGRYAHTLAVARLAEELAGRHGLDAGRARLAGLLHDCGRSIPVSRMPGYVRRHGVAVPCASQTIRRAPLLLHAYISADLAARRLGVSDPEVLSAVRRHTLGAPNMTPLDRLLYVADAASTDRRYPGVGRLRRLARLDLDKAFRECVRRKLAHARAADGWLHPQTERTWKSLAR